MNIEDTTVMYPNDKLLTILSEERYRDVLLSFANKTKTNFDYSDFNFAIISHSPLTDNIGIPVMLFGLGENVQWCGINYECVLCISGEGLKVLNVDTKETYYRFGASIPKEWLYVLTFDEVESIIGVRPLVITYTEKPHSENLK